MRRWLSALPLLLAACQPLPHPFADYAPKPGSSLLALPDTTSVSIAPIEGRPRAFAEKLAPALAKALQKRNIAASATTTSLTSRELDGLIHEIPAVDGETTLLALWRVRDSRHRLIGTRVVRINGAPQDWRAADKNAVARAATIVADDLTLLLHGTPPVKAAPVPAAGTGASALAKPGVAAKAAATHKLRLRIGAVTGAPGDGDAALARAMALLLAEQGMAIVTDPKAPADLRLDADVSVGKARAGKQHVKIVWHLRRPKGGEIGTVGQQNDVPAGLLDGTWGNLAYAVATAAEGGIRQLVARAAPNAAASGPGPTRRRRS